MSAFGGSMTARSSGKSIPTIEVSRATPEDVASVQDVLYRVWLTTYPNKALGITVADIEEMYKDRNSKETLARMRERISSANEITLVAKENGKVVGVCRVIRREDKDVMEAIYVLPEYQRLGIGSAIWRENGEAAGLKKENNRAGGYLQYRCYRVLQTVRLSRYRKAMGRKKI